MAVRIVEAFSGAGGFSALLGRQFDVRMALDIDPQVEAVYPKNRPGDTLHPCGHHADKKFQADI